MLPEASPSCFLLKLTFLRLSLLKKLNLKNQKLLNLLFELQDPQAVPAVRSNLVKAASVGSLLSLDSDGPMSGESRGRTGSVKSTKSDNSQYNSDKHSMMEFAMHYFRFGR